VHRRRRVLLLRGHGGASTASTFVSQWEVVDEEHRPFAREASASHDATQGMRSLLRAGRFATTKRAHCFRPIRPATPVEFACPWKHVESRDDARLSKAPSVSKPRSLRCSTSKRCNPSHWSRVTTARGSRPGKQGSSSSPRMIKSRGRHTFSSCPSTTSRSWSSTTTRARTSGGAVSRSPDERHG
jgi:hypothetical protein